MAGIKIYAKVWNNLKEYEKDYILRSAPKHGLSYCKIVLSECKKQIIEKIKTIYGVGLVECENGNKYIFSGQDTRKFTKIN